MQIRKSKQAPKLGALLLDLGIIQKKAMDEAAQVARDSGQPIGRVLLMLGYVSDHMLKCTVYAQSLVTQGLLPYDTAIDALRLCGVHHITLEKALEQMGVQPIEEPDKHYLGLILLNAGYVNQSLFDEAVKNKEETGMLIGRFFVLKGAITNAILGNALEALSMVRDDRLTVQQAGQVLGHMRTKRVTFHEALEELGVGQQANRRAKLGDLLSMSGLISDTQNLEAVEMGLQVGQMLGQILTEAGMVSEEALRTALSLQDLVAKGVLTKHQAGEVLRQVQSRGITVKQLSQETPVFRKNDPESQMVINLFRTAGMITDADINGAVQSQREFNMDPLPALLASGFLDRDLFEAAREALLYLNNNEVTMEQAIVALQLCQRSRSNFRQACEELKFVEPQPEKVKVTEQIKKKPAPVLETQPPVVGPKEIKTLVLLAIFFAMCGFVVITFVPVQYQNYALWTLVVALAFTMMGIGRTWGQRQDREQEQLAMRIQDVRALRKKKTGE